MSVNDQHKPDRILFSSVHQELGRCAYCEERCDVTEYFHAHCFELHQASLDGPWPARDLDRAANKPLDRN